MTHDTRSHSLKAQSEYVPARRGRRSAQRGADTIHLHLERLEERIVLSGFGPEDGSYIVENREGSYTSIQIQPSDQKIVAAGNFPVRGWLSPVTTPSAIWTRATVAAGYRLRPLGMLPGPVSFSSQMAKRS